MSRLLTFNPEPFETESEIETPFQIGNLMRSRIAPRSDCQHATAPEGSPYFQGTSVAVGRRRVRHEYGLKQEPYPFAIGGPDELFEMERFEYEQGVVSPPLRSALGSFQQKRGLLADGTASPKIQAVLRTALQASPCSNPADILDCANIPLPQSPTREERKRIKRGGAVAEGVYYDVTSSVTNALKAVHLTHYDVNDWEISKERHLDAMHEIIEFINRHLSQNPGEVLKVSITGSASRTGKKEYNDILSCKRAKVATGYIRGTVQNPDRVIIDESGQGFCAATCRTKNECENPDYRAMLIVVHQPDKSPDPIRPEVGSCLYQIRCCSFRSISIVDLALDLLLDQTKSQEILQKYPMLKPLVTMAYSAVKSWLKKSLKGLASKLIEVVEKYVYVEFIRLKAVFQIEDRDPHQNSSTLCYGGWGFRVKIPDISGLDKDVDEALKRLPVPEAAKKLIKNAMKKALKVDIGLEHLEGKCAPASFVPFQLSGQLQGPSNEPTCLKRRINIFVGAAAVGTDVTATGFGPAKIGVAFMNNAFKLGNTRLAKCVPVCDRNSIVLPLGHTKGFEFFLDSRGELKLGPECNCGECTAAMRFVRAVPAVPRRMLRHN